MQRCGRGEGQSMGWCDRNTYRPLTGRLAITLRSLTASTARIVPIEADGFRISES